MTRHARPHGKLKDLTGQVFDRWRAICPAPARPKKTFSAGSKAYWECLCACGTRKEVSGQHLREGKSRGCRACFDARGNRRCSCPVRCQYCGRRRSRDAVGHFCRTRNCQQQHAFAGCNQGAEEDHARHDHDQEDGVRAAAGGPGEARAA